MGVGAGLAAAAGATGFDVGTKATTTTGTAMADAVGSTAAGTAGCAAESVVLASALV
jgi:hypothetical protein